MTSPDPHTAPAEQAGERIAAGPFHFHAVDRPMDRDRPWQLVGPDGHYLGPPNWHKADACAFAAALAPPPEASASLAEVEGLVDVLIGLARSNAPGSDDQPKGPEAEARAAVLGAVACLADRHRAAPGAGDVPAEFARLSEAATAGPWEVIDKGPQADPCQVWHDGQNAFVCETGDMERAGSGPDDAALIVAAVNRLRYEIATTPSPEGAARDAGAGDVARAVRDVLAERRRQVAVEGWTAAHDRTHHTGQLAMAAACYAGRAHAGRKHNLRMPFHWPWEASWWKPSKPRRMLVKAGALILAELERLDRASPSTGPAGRADGEVAP